MNVLRRISRAIHSLDHAKGRLGKKRRVLVEMRTPVYVAVLGPVCESIRELPDTEIFYTSEYPERIKPLIQPERFVTQQAAEWMRFDLYLNADPWAAARLRRCARRINFFHGVAGKYDLDGPRSLPMGFEYYDRVAFINADRMNRYLKAGVVTKAQAALVGYPKLDRLAGGAVDGKEIRDALGLDPGKPTVLYAPTYSPASSLHLAGEEIVLGLANAGFNVLVKLHDRSLDTDPRYTAGIDWRTRMRAIETRGDVHYVEGPDASPYLAAADLMVTDHSSVGFEYLILDRPLIVFDVPGLVDAARINPEKVEQLRSAARVVRSVGELTEAATAELAAPGRLSAERQRVAADIFYKAGGATPRAMALIQAVLADSTRSRQPLAEPIGREPLGGGVS
jgi:hypothetical protein